MPGVIRRAAARIQAFLADPTLDALWMRPETPDPATQILLRLAYQRLVQDGRPLPSFGDAGFTCRSQTDEDGILLLLFAVLGTQTKQCVEICAGDGTECNTANLILNHGWHGLLVDGDREQVERGRQFYGRSRRTYVYPPRFAHAWITKDTVNELITAHGFSGEIDLLSLDLDGVDYWIWDAIDVVAPRVVVVEYLDLLGPDRACTVPYADSFSAARDPHPAGRWFAGASLQAFVKLGRRKGYRLVGVNRLGFNAFFVRDGLGEQFFPTIDPRACFGHRKVVEGLAGRAPAIADAPWVDV